MHEYPAELTIQPLAKPVNATVSVPGSKSITNRALVLAALASRETGCTLTGALRSEDTEVMVECLGQLGFIVEPEWNQATIRVQKHNSDRLIPNETADLNVANSGTTIRFLTAMVSLSPGRYRLDGIPRMRERPIQDLLDTLQQLGVNATSENRNGCPPVVVQGNGWTPAGTNSVNLRAGISSQFLSGLMMAAAFNPNKTSITISGELVSEPYVRMTKGMIDRWRRHVEVRRGNTFIIDGETGVPLLPKYDIEPDASAASYFWAVPAIAGGKITVSGLDSYSTQGDVGFVDALGKMGCWVGYDHPDGSPCVTVESGKIKGIDIDMNAISDTVMTLAAVACFAEGPTTIRNVAHIRHKETDRIAAVATELRKLGVEVEEYPDGLKITPRPMTGCAVETYNDHRMAMSLALIGLKVPGVIIKNPGCVAKTYPGFWQDFEKLRN